MATNTVNRSVNIFIQSGEAEKAQQRVIDKNKQIEDSLKKATDPVVINRLTKELKAGEVQLDRITKKVKGEVAPSLRDLKNTVNVLGKRFETMTEDDADFTKVLLQLNKAKLELGEMKGKVDQLNNGFKNSAATSNSFFSGFTKFAANVGALAVANVGVQAAVGFIGDSIAEFEQAELAVTRFEAKLNNLDAGDAIPRLTAFAEDLAEQFEFLDNDDIIGVFEQLINYGKLTETQIRQLTPVIIDFAAQQQVSVQESASVIIKALGGNGKALKEYGINIKDAKNESEAFGIVMTQLKPKVEGVAETFSNTLAGSAAESKQEIADLKEEIGEGLQPVVLEFYKFMGGAVSGMRDFFGDISGNLKQLGKELIAIPWRLLGFDMNTRDKKPENTGANNTVVQDEVKRFIAADKQKQQAILKALATQYRENITAYNKAVKENDQAAINTYARLVNTDAAVLRAINAKKDTRVLGTGDLNKPDAEKKTGKSKEQLEREKAIEEAKKLAEELKKLSEDLLFFNADQITKEIRAVDLKYEQLRIRAKGNAEMLKEIDDLNARERQLVYQNYYDKLQEQADKNAEELRKKTEAEAQKLKELFEKRQLAFLEFSRQQLEDRAKQGVQQLEDGAELRVLQSRGFKRQQALRDQLKIQEEIEVAAAEKTGESVELIREKYRQKTTELLRDQITEIAGYIQQGLQAVTALFDAISEKENQRLDDNRRRYDRERQNYQQLLDNQKLSKDEYNKKVAALNRKQDVEEAAIRKKQFNRDKALALTNAAINTAVAITRVLGNPFLVALAAAVGAIQIGIIAAQKPPQFAKGGVLKGPRHGNGGMPVINPITGSVEAEVEGGEAILSRRFVQNNPTLVAAALESSKNGGYNIEAPFNRTALRPMNVGLINSSMGNVRRYESGGIMPAANNQQLAQENEQLKAILNRLADKLDQPFIGLVTLNSFEDAQERKALIVEDATMR
jgi:hypothetical protein